MKHDRVRDAGDLVLCSMLLSDTHESKLTGKEREAFGEFREQLEDSRPLSEKQRQWLWGVGEKLGLVVRGSRNLFSCLSEEAQAEQLERAAKVKLPWEQPGFKRVLKPPPRRVD